MVKRYQRGNQNQSIDEEQTIQWPKDTKGAIRISKLTKNRQYNGQKIPKRQSDSIKRRGTDNTMAKRKETKIQKKNYKTLHRKLKIEPREPH